MVIANFINKQDALVTGLDQYDYGQVLRIQGLKLPTAVEIHFGLEETGGTTTTRIGVTKDGVTDVPIPDSMLENGDTSLDYTIYAFVYLTDDTSGKTVYRIKIQVKARSKPELLNKPEDKELFQKAIEAVNQSAKEAEGWAHGREDMPERATDNAKYYSEQASGSAEEVKKVEQSVKDMVATIDGIEQQVQDVKEYTGQAKTAAENALLSEQEAKKSEEASLQHRTGAETAENNAEVAENNAKKSEQAVEQAKQLVMQMGQDVLNNKNQVAEKVEAFNKVVTDAVDAVGTVKMDAVDAVGTKGTEQTKMVSDEGAKQVKAVEDKGNEVLQSIPEDFTTQMESKLDKQQGAENKGKALVVGDDGNVAVGEVTGGDGIPIINTMSGESPLVVPDSAERVNKGVRLSGNTEQLTTTGKNLFNYKDFVDINTYQDNVGNYRRKYLQLKPNTSYCMTIFKNRMSPALDVTVMFVGTEEHNDNTEANGVIVFFTSTDKKSAIITTKESGRIVFKLNKGSTPELQEEYLSKADIILSEGATEIPYEPYTGGKPSPSPDYPQEIKSVGKWNEVTQKYEVDIKVTNAKESWDKEQTITITSDRLITKWDKLVEQDGQIGWLYKHKNITLNGGETWKIHGNNMAFYTELADSNFQNSFCDKYKHKFSAWAEQEYGIYSDNHNAQKYFRPPHKGFEMDIDVWKVFLNNNPLTVICESMSTEFVPLQQSEQDAIRALKTYYPTTVITVDGGEVVSTVELTYTADTKNFILNREKAMQAQMLNIQSALISQKISGGIKVTDSSGLPVEEFSMSGKMVQNGTPTPTNPVDIEVTPQGIITVDFTDGTNHQVIELNCPREFTKWDRLEKIDGVWNWVFRTCRYIITGDEEFVAAGKEYTTGSSANFYTNVVQNAERQANGFMERLRSVDAIWSKVNETGFCINATQLHMRLPNTLLGVSDTATKEEKKTAYVNYLKAEYKKGTPYSLMYEQVVPELIPLSQSEQDKLNALTMYAPNTEITNTGGCNMELTYTVDTKSYVDAKIAEVSTAVVQKGIENV